MADSPCAVCNGTGTINHVTIIIGPDGKEQARQNNPMPCGACK